MSPATGANTKSGSYVEKENVDPFFTQEFVAFVSRTVFADEKYSSSKDAPLNRDLRGLPRLMIVVGGREMLLDDSVLFAQKAREAGVDVTLDQNDDSVHVYPVFVDVLPEARPALERIALFLKK
jgi:acetyl esterase/lipase